MTPQPQLFEPVISLAGYREQIAQPVKPFDIAMKISQTVSNLKWSGEQQRAVDDAIAVVA